VAGGPNRIRTIVTKTTISSSRIQTMGTMGEWAERLSGKASRHRELRERSRVPLLGSSHRERAGSSPRFVLYSVSSGVWGLVGD